MLDLEFFVVMIFFCVGFDNQTTYKSHDELQTVFRFVSLRQGHLNFLAY